MNSEFEFKIIHRSKKSKARAGIIKSPHGDIKTPAFVPCATKGSLKSLSPTDIDDLNLQLLFANTYHLVLSPGLEVLKKAGGIHNLSKIDKPMITDSGGFQVFSLAKRSENILSERSESKDVTRSNQDPHGIASSPDVRRDPRNDKKPTLVKNTNDGVKFRSHIDGKEFYFTPEFSIKAQKFIGADFIVAFDECVYYGANEKYTKKSMERTHEWARRSLDEFKVQGEKFKVGKTSQQIYGVIQGGMFMDLRKQSAKFISSLPFWGLAIGGVSVGETKKEMRDQVSWVMPIIKKDPRPVHLLGIGHLDDIIDMVKMGIDTFDCVVPTRHARTGKLYHGALSIERKTQELIDIFQSKYKNDLSPLDTNCQCYTCQTFSRAYLHHLFKQRELLGYRLATIHNLFFIEKYFEKIRRNIVEGVV